MQSMMVDVSTDDGVADCYLAQPDRTTPGPAVLFFPDGIGLRPRLYEMADRIASHGYTVLVPNVFYRSGRAPLVDNLDELLASGDRDKLMGAIWPAVRGLDPADVMRDTHFYLDYLAGVTGVAAGAVGLTGYCMGAGLVLRAAGTYPDRIAAAGGFHGGNLASDAPTSPHLLAGNIQAELYFGARRCRPVAAAGADRAPGRRVAGGRCAVPSRGVSRRDPRLHDERHGRLQPGGRGPALDRTVRPAAPGPADHSGYSRLNALTPGVGLERRGAPVDFDGRSSGLRGSSSVDYLPARAFLAGVALTVLAGRVAAVDFAGATDFAAAVLVARVTVFAGAGLLAVALLAAVRVAGVFVAVALLAAVLVALVAVALVAVALVVVALVVAAFVAVALVAVRLAGICAGADFTAAGFAAVRVVAVRVVAVRVVAVRVAVGRAAVGRAAVALAAADFAAAGRTGAVFTRARPDRRGRGHLRQLARGDLLLEADAGPECRYRGLLHLDRLAGAGIARGAGCPLTLLEHAEAGERNLVALGHCVLDFGDNRFEGRTGRFPVA